MSNPDQRKAPRLTATLRFARELAPRINTVPWRAIYRIVNINNLTFLAVLATLAITTFAYSIQNKEYAEQSFTRSQGSINLAWRTLDDANDHFYEVGQSAALLYLSNLAQLQGRITLTHTAINISTYDITTGKYRQADIALSNSALCGDNIVGYGGKSIVYDFSHSIMRDTELSGEFVSDDFVGVDLRNAHFINVNLTNSRLAASMLENVVLHGGKFVDVDFQGATLRGLVTERGSVGVGSQDYGYDYSTYTPDFPVQWPVLFDKNKGRAEVLETLGMASNPSADNFMVDFSSSNFKDADLRGAHLENSNISQKQVNQACADSTTVLRPGVTVEEPCTSASMVEELRRSDELRKAIRVYVLHSGNVAAARCQPE